jgi:hypothetical protein
MALTKSASDLPQYKSKKSSFSLQVVCFLTFVIILSVWLLVRMKIIIMRASLKNDYENIVNNFEITFKRDINKAELGREKMKTWELRKAKQSDSIDDGV